MEDVINQGIAENIDYEIIKDILTKSYRSKKQVDHLEVKKWITDYKGYKTNKLPYVFINTNHYDEFVAEFNSLYKKYGLKCWNVENRLQ